jgi:proteasome accessory factor C
MGHLTKDSSYRVADLATSLGATPAELAADLEALSMCGANDLDPYSLVPVMIENGTVEVFGHMPALSGPVRLSSAEATALAAALQAAGFTANDPLVAKILSAASAGFDAEELEHTVRAAVSSHEHSVFGILADAAQSHTVIEIDYTGTGAPSATTRRVEPAALFAERGAWYVTAWCHRSGSWRTFRIDRIREARVTGETFDPSVHGEPGPISAFDVTGLPLATLRFLAEEPFVEREWPGARLAEGPDVGTTIVEVPYGGTGWIARRVVARLGRVEVLGPAELREAVKALAHQELSSATAT